MSGVIGLIDKPPTNWSAYVTAKSSEGANAHALVHAAADAARAALPQCHPALLMNAKTYVMWADRWLEGQNDDLVTPAAASTLDATTGSLGHTSRQQSAVLAASKALHAANTAKTLGNPLTLAQEAGTAADAAMELSAGAGGLGGLLKRT